MKSFRELLVWQRAMEVIDFVYEITKRFPGEEQYGLTNQIRRAAISISTNIAEGWGRNTRKQFAQYLAIAFGSLTEVECCIEIAKRRNYISNDKYLPLDQKLKETGFLLYKLKKSLQV